MDSEKSSPVEQLNVLGQPLELCSCKPLTGWFRDGFCRSDVLDLGQHTVCCVVTDPFLTYSKAQGNDLTTPALDFGFPGLREGDQWCLCAPRWKQSYDDGMAPMVRLEATEIGALTVIGIDILMKYAYKEN